MSDENAKRVGDYEILGVLGAGGMGKVFKVRNVISDRIEAMKILLPDLAGRQDLAGRFLREIKVLAALDHPNIAALRTALTLANQLVMVMEYVEGTTLATRLEQGPIPVDQAVNYIVQVLDALSYAHGRNVIHRDIKPPNMMLTPQGVIKLMDFGIARSGTDRGLTATGTTMGSLYYMSPEQVKGAATDARSDLYSVGVSLYEMVTGERPFVADSDYSIMAAQIQQQPRPPIELRADLPQALNDIILTAMAKDPAQRFQSADAFRAALSHVKAAPQTNAAASVQGKPAAPVGATSLFQGEAASAAPTASLVPPAPVAAQASSQQSMPSQGEPTPSVMELSSRQNNHRGLYMALGALVVVAVLIAAGLYVPHWNKARAAEDAAKNQAQKQAQTADQQATQPSAQPAQPEQNVNQATPNPPSEPAAGAAQSEPAKPVSPDSSGTAKHGAKDQSAKSVPPQDSGTNDQPQSQPQSSDQAAQLEELEQQMDQLSSRATSVSTSLDNLQRQQSAQGLGLRGDIASTQEMMKSHMAKAQAAMQNQDARNAKKYLDLAEPEIERLEKFLGR
jgi:eukaryotic-like serine/threonine-protein kinase